MLIIIYYSFSENKPKTHLCGLFSQHMLMGNNVMGLTVKLTGLQVCPRCAGAGDAVSWEDSCTVACQPTLRRKDSPDCSSARLPIMWKYA